MLISGEPVRGLISGPGEPSGPIGRDADTCEVVVAFGSKLRLGVVAAVAGFSLGLPTGEALNGDPIEGDAKGDFEIGSCVICTPRSTGLVGSVLDMEARVLAGYRIKMKRKGEMVLSKCLI